MNGSLKSYISFRNLNSEYNRFDGYFLFLLVAVSVIDLCVTPRGYVIVKIFVYMHCSICD